MQPAIANLEVAMVAQPGQDPALQLASTGKSPVASNDEKKDEPEQAWAKLNASTHGEADGIYGSQ